MTNSQYRLDDDAYQILLRHKGVSVTLSDAVRNMENELKLLQNVTKSLQSEAKVTQPPEKKLSWIEKSAQALSSNGGIAIGSMDSKEYWKQMKTELDGIIASHAGR